MKMIDRQYPLHAVAKMTSEDFGADGALELGIPANAVLLSVSSLTTGAFDATTATLTVTDGTTSFMTDADVKAAGADVGTGVPKYYPTKGKLKATLGGTDTPGTTGTVIVMLSYVIVGRGGEIQE